MKHYPSAKEIRHYFRRIPMWAIVLIGVLLYARLVTIALFYWMS